MAKLPDRLTVAVDADKATAEMAKLAQDIRQSVARLEMLLAPLRGEEDGRSVTEQRYKPIARRSVARLLVDAEKYAVAQDREWPLAHRKIERIGTMWH